MLNLWCLWRMEGGLPQPALWWAVGSMDENSRERPRLLSIEIMTDTKGVDAITPMVNKKRGEPRQNPQRLVFNYAISVQGKQSNKKDNGYRRAGVIGFLGWFSWGSSYMEPQLVNAFIQCLLFVLDTIQGPRGHPNLNVNLQSFALKIILWSCESKIWSSHWDWCS